MEQEREERKGRNRGEKREAWGSGIKDSKGTWGEKKTVSYTHLTLPTNREV